MAAYVCPSAVKLWRSYILTPLCGGGRRLRFLAAYKTPNPARGNRRDSLTVQIHLFLMNYDHSEIASAHFGQLVCGWTSASNQHLLFCRGKEPSALCVSYYYCTFQVWIRAIFYSDTSKKRNTAAQCEWIVIGFRMQRRKYPTTASDTQQTHTSADGRVAC